MHPLHATSQTSQNAHKKDRNDGVYPRKQTKNNRNIKLEGIHTGTGRKKEKLKTKQDKTKKPMLQSRRCANVADAAFSHDP